MATAPFHHVAFADFWLADQMNSLALVLLDLQYVICFYATEVNWVGEQGKSYCLARDSISESRSHHARMLLAVY